MQGLAGAAAVAQPDQGGLHRPQGLHQVLKRLETDLLVPPGKPRPLVAGVGKAPRATAAAALRFAVGQVVLNGFDEIPPVARLVGGGRQAGRDAVLVQLALVGHGQGVATAAGSGELHGLAVAVGAGQVALVPAAPFAVLGLLPKYSRHGAPIVWAKRPS